MIKFFTFLRANGGAFSAPIGPVLYFLVNKNVLPFSFSNHESVKTTANCAFWALIVQLLIVFADWSVHKVFNSVTIQVSNDLRNLNEKTTVSINCSNPVNMVIVLSFSGSKKSLEKKKLEVIFPNQVFLQPDREVKENGYYRIEGGQRVIINIAKIIEGQAKYLESYNQNLYVGVDGSGEIFTNKVQIESQGCFFEAKSMTETELYGK
ncbi:hypothetical protein PUF88_01700 [Lactobacillaceae bacterium L1_55_11]|nr:hypothetical protein [Lactobacillaceae bacterium L1_55_11]